MRGGDTGAWPSERAQAALDALLAARGVTGPADLDWALFEECAALIDRALSDGVRKGSFRYRHPAALQPYPGPQAREYEVRMAYTEWGRCDAPLVLCLGGIANTARRFDILGRKLGERFRVVSLDWAGRGASGWLAEQSDYGFESCVAQAQALLDHVGGAVEAVIGSSLGGAVAIRLVAEAPARFRRLVLNDVGPLLPAARRRYRARVIGRHYVFRTPAELFRRAGAAQKNDGPIDDAMLLYNCLHLTRWSSEEEGRVYRYDPRALLAYRDEADRDLDVRGDWERVHCPVLVLHALLSDNLLDEIWRPMAARPNVWIRHVPDTGHTPALSDRTLISALEQWLREDPARLPREETLPALPAPHRVLFGLPVLPAGGRQERGGSAAAG